MAVKVSYPHDPERLDRWIGKHASVIQATIALTWLGVSVASVLLGLWRPLLLLVIPIWALPSVVFWVWAYQEGGGPVEGGGGGGNEG